jgi:hypothetical protein
MERPEQNQNVPVKTWTGFTEWAEILGEMKSLLICSIF